MALVYPIESVRISGGPPIDSAVPSPHPSAARRAPNAPAAVVAEIDPEEIDPEDGADSDPAEWAEDGAPDDAEDLEGDPDDETDSDPAAGDPEMRYLAPSQAVRWLRERGVGAWPLEGGVDRIYPLSQSRS